MRVLHVRYLCRRPRQYWPPLAGLWQGRRVRREEEKRVKSGMEEECEAGEKGGVEGEGRGVSMHGVFGCGCGLERSWMLPRYGDRIQLTWVSYILLCWTVPPSHSCGCNVPTLPTPPTLRPLSPQPYSAPRTHLGNTPVCVCVCVCVCVRVHVQM